MVMWAVYRFKRYGR